MSCGCKGCTTYRPNEVTGAVLAARAESNAGATPQPPQQPELPLPPPAPAATQARRHLRGGRRRLYDAAA